MTIQRPENLKIYYLQSLLRYYRVNWGKMYILCHFCSWKQNMGGNTSVSTHGSPIQPCGVCSTLHVLHRCFVLREATTEEVCQFNESVQNKALKVEPTAIARTPSLRNQKTINDKCWEVIKDLPGSFVSEWFSSLTLCFLLQVGRRGGGGLEKPFLLEPQYLHPKSHFHPL